jgi:hypothetical protein
MLAFGSQPFRDHLKENSFWRDPSSGAVRSPDTALRRAISNNTLATVVGDLVVAGVIAKSADVLAQKLSQVDASIDTLRADWTYGLELLLSQAEAQNRRLTDIVAKLDEIHKTLESPLLTQARELYRIGSERLSKGLLDKALEAFLQAEQKNDADFFIEYQIGSCTSTASTMTITSSTSSRRDSTSNKPSGMARQSFRLLPSSHDW